MAGSVSSGLEHIAGVPQAVQGGAHQDAGPALGCDRAAGLLLYQLLVHLGQRLGALHRHILAAQGSLQFLQPEPPSCQVQPANLWASERESPLPKESRGQRFHTLLPILTVWSAQCRAAQQVCPACRVAARECDDRGIARQGRRTERAPVMLLLLWASSVRPIQWAGSQ